MAETEILTGRPRGGTAILWKSNFAHNVKPISCDSVRLSAILVSLTTIVSVLVCNVYMTCDARYVGDNLTEYIDVLNEISCLIHKHVPTYYIIGGDFNTNFKYEILHSV